MKIILSLVLSVLSFTLLFGQEWSSTSTGVPEPSMAFDDYYGKSISMEGNLAAVGAPENDESNLNSGKVFFYEKVGDNWQMVEELFSEDIDTDIQVYPNPFEGYVRITGSNIQSIELLNTDGKSILTSSGNFSDVITTDLGQGIYIY